jgi:hypothetical protein
MKRRSLIAVGLMTAVLYNNWLVGPWLNSVLWAHNGSVSEFSAAGQPGHSVFRLLDVSAGLLLIFLGWRLFKALGNQAAGKLLAVSVALLGFANILDAIFVLPCSQALSSNCHVPISLSFHHLQLPAHAYSSSLIGLCYFLVPLLGLVYAWQTKLRRMAAFSALIFIDSLYSLVSTLIEYQRNGGPTARASGASQEVEMMLIGIWLVICVYETARPSKMVADARH